MLELRRAPGTSQPKARTARPTVITVIAILELAAAFWDGRIFEHFNVLFHPQLNSLTSIDVLLPALMCIMAIYAGVGLLQMRRSAMNAWFIRHAWLSAFYLLTIPGLLYQSMFAPGLNFVITWRFVMIVFSLVAGIYLYAVSGSCGDRGVRAAR
ncbi:MAG TPA: hypothetical protein VFJ58_12200 [Armatimonadota bacterium]|nr:hypothetical protein [Armatimonadota bacterium]